MESLREICAEEGLEIEYTELTISKRVLGWYLPFPPRGGIILLDNSLKDDPPMELWVLGEEVGHYKTTPTGTLISYGVHNNEDALRLNRMKRWKDESRAVRWAARHLMPTAEIARAVREGVKTVDELAAFFELKPWMAVRRMNILRRDLFEQAQLRVHLGDLFSPLLVGCLWLDQSFQKGALNHEALPYWNSTCRR